jgi:hypothetical protein
MRRHDEPKTYNSRRSESIKERECRVSCVYVCGGACACANTLGDGERAKAVERGGVGPAFGVARLQVHVAEGAAVREIHRAARFIDRHASAFHRIQETC